jgi:AcrR family transcriptional regulator
VTDAAESQQWHTKSKNGRTLRLPAARRRDQLLEAAIQAFGQSGFHSTSMEDVALVAGVTKPVLYQHFPSKRLLYQQLLETIGEELVAAVVSSATAETPRQQVLGGFRAYFRFVGLKPHAFRLLFGTGARADEQFTATIRGVEDRLAAVIATYISAGLDDDHRTTLGYAIVGLAEVTGRKWASTFGGAGGGPVAAPPGLDLAEGERLATQLADLVWAGLRGLPRTE